MEKTKKGLIMFGLGIACVVLALIADVVGLGSSGLFGYKQIGLLVVGIVLIVASKRFSFGCCSKKE